MAPVLAMGRLLFDGMPDRRPELAQQAVGNDARNLHLVLALELLGAAEPAEIPFNDFGEHSIRRVLRSRAHIATLALRGQREAAEALIAAAWSEATDSFNTNTQFTLMPLSVCEILRCPCWEKNTL